MVSTLRSAITSRRTRALARIICASLASSTVLPKLTFSFSHSASFIFFTESMVIDRFPFLYRQMDS